jgi:hypothetical protein
MIDRSHDLPVTRQAKALNVSRGRVIPRPVSAGGFGRHAAHRRTASGIPLHGQPDVARDAAS